MFGVIYEPFEIKTTPKVCLFRPKTNAEVLPKLLKKLWKSQAYTFWNPIVAKTRLSMYQKSSILGSIFDLRAVYLACWYWKKIKVILPYSKKKKYIFYDFLFSEMNAHRNTPYSTPHHNKNAFCMYLKWGWGKILKLISHGNESHSNSSLGE